MPSKQLTFFIWFRCLLILISLLGLTACDSAELSKAKIKGRVTLDGQPISEGVVNFRPVHDDAPTASGMIKNGEYTAEVPTKSMKVLISAPKIIGQRKAYNTPDSPTQDIIKELIPAKYNIKSELTYDIKPDTKEVNFDLKSEVAPGK